MQTFTLGLGSWMRCLVARNPLVRGSDRVEAVAVLVVVLVSLLSVPVVGAVGTATNDSLTRHYAMARATRHEVTATVTEDSLLAPLSYERPFLTPVRWTYDGAERTGKIRTHRMKSGEATSIWVDADGELTSPPLPDEAAATEAVMTGFGLWIAAVGVSSAAFTALRLRLNRSRAAAWDRALEDLADNGGRSDHRY